MKKFFLLIHGLQLYCFQVIVQNNRTYQEMREDINTFAQRKEHAVSNMAIIVLLSHGEDGLVFGTGIYWHN